MIFCVDQSTALIALFVLFVIVVVVIMAMARTGEGRTST